MRRPSGERAGGGFFLLSALLRTTSGRPLLYHRLLRVEGDARRQVAVLPLVRLGRSRVETQDGQRVAGREAVAGERAVARAAAAGSAAARRRTVVLAVAVRRERAQQRRTGYSTGPPRSPTGQNMKAVAKSRSLGDVKLCGAVSSGRSHAAQPCAEIESGLEPSPNRRISQAASSEPGASTTHSSDVLEILMVSSLAEAPSSRTRCGMDCDGCQRQPELRVRKYSSSIAAVWRSTRRTCEP